MDSNGIEYGALPWEISDKVPEVRHWLSLRNFVIMSTAVGKSNFLYYTVSVMQWQNHSLLYFGQVHLKIVEKMVSRMTLSHTSHET
jgi:hypothetical protein